jgi:hypothetical protein
MKQLSLFSESSQAFIHRMRDEAVKIAEENGEVSADDIRSRFEIPLDVSRNALGSLFKCSMFAWKGVKRSITPSRAGGMISVWALSNNYRKGEAQ